MEIKKVHKNNISDLIEIFGKYQIFYNQIPDQNKNYQFLEEVIAKNNAIFHIAYHNQRAVGFIGVYFSYSSTMAKKIAIINDLFVLEEERKCGIGKELMKHIINHLKNLQISHIRWCTKEDNLQAQDFYKNFAAQQSKWMHYDFIKDF